MNYGRIPAQCRPPVFRTTVVLLAYLALTPAGCGRQNSPEPRGTTVISPSGVVESAIRLVDVTQTTGLHFTYRDGHEAGEHTILEWMGGGVAVLDYDADGRPDLAFAGGGRFEQRQVLGSSGLLARGVGPWQFADVTAQAGVRTTELYSQGCHAADYDNDGFVDLLLTGYQGVVLLHNEGDGTFQFARHSGLAGGPFSTSAAWADVNADGALDLYVCHYVDWSFDNHPTCHNSEGVRDACPPRRFGDLPDLLYVSNGDGTFREASQEAGLKRDGKGLGVIAADFDQDGHIDFYVANDYTPNFLYRNDGHGHFREEAAVRGVAGDDVGRQTGSMGVSVGDYNGDGRPDIWVTNYIGESFALYANLGGGQFLHVSRTAGIDTLEGAFVGFGTGFVDLDGDGDDDLLVVNGHVLAHDPGAEVFQRPIVFLNEQNRYQRQQFATAGFSPYLANAHLGRGLTWADLDSDGDLDFVVSHLREPVALLNNQTPTQHDWLAVRLVGRTTNREAIGCELTLQIESQHAVKWIVGGGSYLSEPDRVVRWAVPRHARLGPLKVVWASGTVSHTQDLHPNQLYLLIEPAPGEELAPILHLGTAN